MIDRRQLEIAGRVGGKVEESGDVLAVDDFLVKHLSFEALFIMVFR